MPNQTKTPKPAGSLPARIFGNRFSGMVRVSACGCRISALAWLLAAGCVSKEVAREQARQAYEAGLQQGQQAAEMKLTHVFLRGPVQKQAIPWREGLTVAQAIVEAVYTAPENPVAINIMRQGRIIPVNPVDLLHGIDPPVEAGDTIDLH